MSVGKRKEERGKNKTLFECRSSDAVIYEREREILGRQKVEEIEQDEVLSGW